MTREAYRNEITAEMIPASPLDDTSVQMANGQLAAIVRSSNDAIASKTNQGIGVILNAAAERMFGYTAAEIVGSSIRIVIPIDC